MAYNKDWSSYRDIRQVLDFALSSEKGVRLACSNLSDAVRWRARFHSFRKLDRHKSKELHDPGHEEWDTSPYDGLTVRLDGAVVLIEKYTPPVMTPI